MLQYSLTVHWNPVRYWHYRGDTSQFMRILMFPQQMNRESKMKKEKEKKTRMSIAVSPIYNNNKLNVGHKFTQNIHSTVILGRYSKFGNNPRIYRFNLCVLSLSSAAIGKVNPKNIIAT